MSDKSLAPNKENCSVLGIGVALKVRVSIFSLNSFLKKNQNIYYK